MQLLLENVRSFRGAHEIPICPLTLLVGENSSGKTTFLGVLAAVSKEGFPATTYSLNVPPYDLGTYDTIATLIGRKHSQAESFSIGYKVGQPDREPYEYMKTTFVSDAGQPKLSLLKASTYRVQISMRLSSGEWLGQIKSRMLEKDRVHKQLVTGDFRLKVPTDLPTPLPVMFSKMVQSLFIEKKEQIEAKHREQILRHLSLLFFHAPGGPYRFPTESLAPVRTRPKRTYDEISADFRPEGEHVPTLMARIWAKGGGKSRNPLRDALVVFGKESGLFNDIDVKRLGKYASSPFQIMVKTAGPWVNLSDVGYGVSQALPILVESILSRKQMRILLQQPEVHLHPRAQASLGTLFVKLVSEANKHFIVETHSDYLLDRIRQEVAKGKIAPEQVLILFFDKPRFQTSIYQLKLDKHGNVHDAPTSYRKFFLSEQQRLLFRD